MFNPRKLCAAAALALCAALPSAAMAAKVLFLSESTTDTPTNNAYDAFLAANGSVDVVDRRGRLTDSAYDFEAALTAGKYDVVVLFAPKGIEQNYEQYDRLMKKRPAGQDNLSFIIFTKNAAYEPDSGAKNMITTLRDATGWDELKLTHLASSNYARVPLNTEPGHSPYVSAFEGLNKGDNGFGDPNTSYVRADLYGVLQCAPKDNALFTYNEKRCQPNKELLTESGLKTAGFTNSYYSASTCWEHSLPSDSTISEGGNKIQGVELNQRFKGYRAVGGGSSKPFKLETQDDVDYYNKMADEFADFWKRTAIDTLHENAALSVIVPQWQSSRGAGACIMFTGNTQVFANYLSTEDPPRIADHDQQFRPLAEAFLTAATGTCREGKPATICEGIDASKCVVAVAPGYEKEERFVIPAGGQAAEHNSDNREQRDTDNPLGKPVSVPGYVNKQCTQKNTSVCVNDINKCCYEPDEFRPSCTKNYMYCSADNVMPSQEKGENEKVCCSDEKRIATGDSGKKTCCDKEGFAAAIASGGTAQVCCETKEADRKNYCKDGEDPSTHCCKAKPTCSGPSAPTTGWPALLGLGALLPLLAARRRRRK
ncbi:MAG: hypothetical protein J6T92_07355 [Ottowia sp.]|nr:hypothetical protein [Ottowia sp.]